MPPLMSACATAGRVLLGRLRQTFFVALGVALLGTIGLVAWARIIASADPAALMAMDSDDNVVVARGDWISFRPRDSEAQIGVIFYPDEKAEPAAYGPVLHRLAADGYLVVLTPMPLNIASLAPNTARQVMEQYPEVGKWVVAGHGRGGMAASKFAERNPESIVALILWGAYPPRFTDLSDAPWPVLSIAGTADHLATPAKVTAAKSRLPQATRQLEIAGADHWGFADFDPALSTATIPREQQQLDAIRATQALLAEIEGDQGSG